MQVFLKLNLNDFVYASLPDFEFHILLVFASFQWLQCNLSSNTTNNVCVGKLTYIDIFHQKYLGTVQ